MLQTACFPTLSACVSPYYSCNTCPPSCTTGSSVPMHVLVSWSYLLLGKHRCLTPPSLPFVCVWTNRVCQSIFAIEPLLPVLESTSWDITSKSFTQNPCVTFCLYRRQVGRTPISCLRRGTGWQVFWVKYRLDLTL